MSNQPIGQMTDTPDICGNGQHTSTCYESMGECGIALCAEFEPLPAEGLVTRLAENWGNPYNASSDSPYLKHDCRLAAAHIARLTSALDDLQQAEAEYRLMHDRHGDSSQAAGRAWDLMRRAGDKARELLNEVATLEALRSDTRHSHRPSPEGNEG